MIKKEKRFWKNTGEYMDKKYKYTYEKAADYCYKGTDILINLLNSFLYL